jgi:hypothetical protein
MRSKIKKSYLFVLVSALFCVFVFQNCGGFQTEKPLGQSQQLAPNTLGSGSATTPNSTPNSTPSPGSSSPPAQIINNQCGMSSHPWQYFQKCTDPSGKNLSVNLVGAVDTTSCSNFCASQGPGYCNYNPPASGYSYGEWGCWFCPSAATMVISQSYNGMTPSVGPGTAGTCQGTPLSLNGIAETAISSLVIMHGPWPKPAANWATEFGTCNLGTEIQQPANTLVALPNCTTPIAKAGNQIISDIIVESGTVPTATSPGISPAACPTDYTTFRAVSMYTNFCIKYDSLNASNPSFSKISYSQTSCNAGDKTFGSYTIYNPSTGSGYTPGGTISICGTPAN